MKSTLLWVVAGMALLTTSGSLTRADDATAPGASTAAVPGSDRSLVDFTKSASSGDIKENNGGTGTINADDGTLKIDFPAGKGYPGIALTDPSGSWNLTGFTGIDAEIKNTGTEEVRINLRVDGGDNWQDSPWDCESSSIAPGETVTVHVTFGQSYGGPGYKMPVDKVLHVLLFATDPEKAASVTVKSIKASK